MQGLTKSAYLLQGTIYIINIFTILYHIKWYIFCDKHYLSRA